MHRLDMDGDFMTRNPLQLSGGEKRKVALASVLIMNPPILVLDEPFVGLDCVSKNEFTKMLLTNLKFSTFKKSHRFLCLGSVQVIYS